MHDVPNGCAWRCMFSPSGAGHPLRFRRRPLPRHVPLVLYSSASSSKPLSSASPDPSPQLRVRSVPARNEQDAQCTNGCPISRSPGTLRRRPESQTALNLVRPLANYKARTARSARHNKHSKKGQRASETHDVCAPRHPSQAKAARRRRIHKPRAGAPFVLVFPLRSLPRPAYQIICRPQDENDEGRVYRGGRAKGPASR
jgi:hypothetical protein